MCGNHVITFFPQLSGYFVEISKAVIHRQNPFRSKQTRGGSNRRGGSGRAQDGGHTRKNDLRVLFLSYVCVGSRLERPEFAATFFGGGQQNAPSAAQYSVGSDSAHHRRAIGSGEAA